MGTLVVCGLFVVAFYALVLVEAGYRWYLRRHDHAMDLRRDPPPR